ncbi:hypothetical protein [Nesterenkonia marinintestina]|uniref:hypothetical protein n=1 Tax=Nesterenkonia marinintestina TaxID=2979865 RepID=UPI0021C21EAA|nr:hypothetical protein [Nesterenkonia sp. GX14115]
MEESRQGLFRLINSRTGLTVGGSSRDLDVPLTTFKPRTEAVLSDQSLTVENLLAIVEWENDPNSWQYPEQVPGGMLVWEYELPMDEQYDELFGRTPGAEDSPNPAERPVETIVEWTLGLLSLAQRPATGLFPKLAKSRVVTFLNLEAPEMDERQVSIDWIRAQPRPVQEEALQRGFSMMYEVQDWMIGQGLTPLSGEDPRMPDLLRLTMQRDRLIAEQRATAASG